MPVKENTFLQNGSDALMESIDLYQKGLMEDMNLTLRLTYGGLTLTTKPVEWVEDLIIFEAPMHQLDYVIYPQNTKLQIIFVSKSALFISSIKVHKKYRKNHSLYYVGKIVSPIIKKQQRESFRLSVIMDIQYHVLPEDKALSNELNLAELPAKDAVCINISTGGMCLKCLEQLPSHRHLLLSFTFMDTPLTLFGEVLFLGEPDTAGTYIHRIKFRNILPTEVNQLNRLIFEKQRLMLKRP